MNWVSEEEEEEWMDVMKVETVIRRIMQLRLIGMWIEEKVVNWIGIVRGE